MKIAIFGLGYVGTVTASCLADEGHKIILVDTDLRKVQSLNSGHSPVQEPFVEALISKHLKTGLLSATSDSESLPSNLDLILIAVGTPTDQVTNKPILDALDQVAFQVAKLIAISSNSIMIGITSTVPPGTTEDRFRSILRNLNTPEDRYALAFIPEFLREGTAVKDFKNPTRFIIGSRNPTEGALFKEIRPELETLTFLVKTEEAEMLKTVDNAWHALKIVFANEISRICQAYGVNSKNVMNLLIQDTRQNISAAYLRPGFSFGGSCLPKDLRSLINLANSKSVSIPMLEKIPTSNHRHLLHSLELICSFSPRRVGLLGLAFKSQTDDLRESPTIFLIKELIALGITVKVHDFLVNPGKLTGTNKQIWAENSFLSRIFHNDINVVMEDVDLIVVAQHNKQYSEYIDSERFPNVIDLTGLK